MASLHSESSSSEVCSPTGSVLVYPNVADQRDDEKEAAPPTKECDHMKSSDDWFQWDTVDPALIRFTLDESDSCEYHTPADRPSSYTLSEIDAVACKETTENASNIPLHRWMKTLRRHAARRHTATMDEMLFDDSNAEAFCQASNEASHFHRRLSSSGSSMGFVEAVKTASVSLASGSIFARSRRNSMRSSRTRTHTDRSSRASISSNRCSEDSVGLDKPRLLDKAAVERSLQRRRILEELISTEEGYIGDVRFLMNVSWLHACVFFGGCSTKR